jgi:alpha-D-ribose 1-methylphosphonate 5-triphosphate synthase subunit PhnG
MTLQEDRQQWLRVLACAEDGELDDALATLSQGLQIEELDIIELRPAEVGTALVTGRVGATGSAFGAGEMTVTRCVVQVNGLIGVGYVRGRALSHARRIAIIDALLQGEHHGVLYEQVVMALAQSKRRREMDRSADIDTSRVEFLTMVRGT